MKARMAIQVSVPGVCHKKKFPPPKPPQLPPTTAVPEEPGDKGAICCVSCYDGFGVLQLRRQVSNTVSWNSHGLE